MTDEDQALDTQQGLRAVLGGVEAGRHATQGGFDQGRTQFGQQSAARERLPNQAEEQSGFLFGGFENNVAGETIGHHHVGGALEDIAAFHVSKKVQAGRGLEQLIRLEHQRVALAFLLANRQQTNAGVLVAGHGLHIRRAHQGKALQEFRAVVGVGPHVGQRYTPFCVREVGDNRGPLHARNAAQAEQTGHQRRARVTLRHHGADAFLTQQAHRHVDREVLALANIGGVVIHVNHVGGVRYRDRQRRPTSTTEFLEFSFHIILAAHQRDRNALPGGTHRAIHHRGWGVITTHCVQGDWKLEAHG